MIPLDFEIQIVKLEAKINDLRHLSHAGDLNITEEVTCLQKKVNQLLSKTYSLLTPWQKVQVARHPERPHFLDYIQYLIQDFTPLAGDRNFAEDPAIIGGLGRFMGQSVMIMGHHKGHDTDSRLKHNFGMARPEGYRKSQRLMNLANHFSLPVITLIDTPGAHPGIDAEERGQAEAIARCIET
jgi:acetyl-CoA carboxylase carboxyl transferase subunit alpha